MMKEFKLTDLEKVGPTTEIKLNKAGIYSPLDIIIRGAKEFARVSGLSEDMARKHYNKMQTMLAESGLDVEVKDIASLKALRGRQIKTKIKADDIDEMTGGGFETQSLYEVYGDEGSGKTQLSMTLAAEALGAGHGVMFIDCEGAFNLERFEQICQARDITYDEDKLGYHLYSDEGELERGIQNMSNELIERDVKYLFIDGLVGLLRTAFEGRGELADRQIELKGILKYLRNMSVLFNMGVIITNQVTANPDPFGAKMKPIGGHVLGHYVKYIYSITKGMKNNRTVRLIKSPNSPQGDYVCFLNEEGVSGFETIKARDKARKMDKEGVSEGDGTKDTSLLIDEDEI